MINIVIAIILSMFCTSCVDIGKYHVLGVKDPKKPVRYKKKKHLRKDSSFRPVLGQPGVLIFDSSESYPVQRVTPTPPPKLSPPEQSTPSPLSINPP
jgi:hypothetical protein